MSINPGTLASRLLVLAGAVLAVGGIAACEPKPADTVSGPAGSAPRQVAVVGAGKVLGNPDTVTINAAIKNVAPDANIALNQTNERMAGVIDAVAAVGIDRKDISTTNVQVQPQYGENSVITGYTATNSIEVKTRKLEAASPVILAIQNTGGNTASISSVDYSITDDSKLVKDARERAFNDAKDRAQQYAQLSGLGLGKVISITEAGATVTPPQPTPRFDTMAGAAVPLQPGQQTVDFSVTVVWELG